MLKSSSLVLIAPLVLLCSTLAAQYTFPTWSQPGQTGDWVSSITIGTWTQAITESTTDNTYHTGQGPGTLQGGTQYTVDLFKTTTFTQSVTLFIDYNGDGDYDDAGEAVGSIYLSGGVNTGGQFNFTVPTTAPSGTTRMRLLVRFTSQTLPLTPTGAFSYGQCDDYDVTISNGSNVTAERNATSFPTVIANSSTVDVALGSSVASLDMLFTIQNGNTAVSNTLTAAVSGGITGFVQTEWEATGVAGTTTAPTTGTFGTAGAITVTLTCTDGSTTGILDFTINVVASITTVASNNVPATVVPPGISNFVATSANISSNVVNQTVTSVTLTKTGSTADGDIAAARLIVDANSNNIVDTGEVQLGTDQTFSGGTATFSLTVPVAGTVDVIIALDLGTGATGSFGIDVTGLVVTPGSVNGLPIVGATHSLLAPVSSLPFSDDFDGTTPTNRQFKTSGAFPGGSGTTITTTNFTTASNVVVGNTANPTPTSSPNQLEIDYPGGDACGAALYYFDWSAFDVGTDQIVLSFQFADNADETDVEDGVFLSLDGGSTWAIELVDTAPGSQTDNAYTLRTANITSLLAAASLNFTSTVVIAFQGQDNVAWTGGDGIAYDDILIELLDDPEINVLDPSNNDVASGTTVNIGDANISVPTTFTWTIENLGLTNNLDVTALAAAPSGVNNVSVNANPSLTPASPITAGNTATFDTDVNPTAVGAFEFTITFTSNDPDEGSYSIIVQGNGVAPSANLQRPASTVLPPSTTDTVTVNTSPSGATNVTWTIGNTGGGTLNITNVVSSNPSSCSAVVTGPVSTTVAPSATTTVDVAITPAAVGPWSFDLTLNSNDPVNPAYTITVDGNATVDAPSIQAPNVPPASSPVLITEVAQDPGTTFDEYIEFTNVSGAPVDISGWVVVVYSTPTNQVINYTMTGATLNAGGTHVLTDVATQTYVAGAEYLGANIGTLQNYGIALFDGATNLMDFVCFGTFNAASVTTPVAIGADWVGAGATNPANSADSAKRIGTQDNNDASDWTTTTGDSLGTANTGLTLPFSISGGATIGGTYPAYTGSVFIGDSLYVEFTADDPNPGDTLSFTISVTGGSLSAAQAGFNETFPYMPTGGSSPHMVNLSGTAATAGDIELTVQVTDGSLTDNYTYTLTIDNPPEMDVTYNAAPVTDGGTINQDMLNVGFTQFTFTIENTGGLDVNLTGTPLVQVTTGANLFGAGVSQNPTTPIPGSGSTTFTIDVTPLASATGAYDFSVSIDNNDPNENPYDFTVTGNLISNLPPVVGLVTGSNWVNAGGGLYTLTVNPGDPINDSLQATDATPDNMTVTVTNPVTAMLGLTTQPVSIATPTAGPISLDWAGTADGANSPGDYDWTIDIDDGTTIVTITARVSITDPDPQHAAVTGITGDGSSGNPYATQFVEGDPAFVTVDLANVTDANTGQTLLLQNVNRTGGTAVGGSGFTFSLSTGVLRVNPAATLVANDVGTNIFAMEVTDGTGAPVVINAVINVLGASGAISFTNTSPLPAATVNQAYTVTLSATGGTGPYTFSLVNATTLPLGLALNPTTGEISGTPTATGVTTFDVRVFDALNDTAVATFQLSVNASGGSGGGGGGDGGGGCASTDANWPVILGLLALLGVIAALRRRVA